MLYHLLYPLAHQVSGLNLFRYITFRTAGAMATAIFICLILGPFFIGLLRKHQVKERIRAEGPASHQKKAGTPTMGGLIIVSGIIIPTLLWSDLTNFYVLMALLVTAWLGLLGYLDDYSKALKHQRNGMVARKKFMGQVGLGLVFGGLLLWVAPNGLYDGMTGIPFFKNYMLDLGVLYIPWMILVLTGASNAVNLTDGADGLAIGLSGLAFLAFGGIAYLTGRLDFSSYLQIEYLPGAGELTVFCGAAIGSALGFLWFNSHPAEVFMGDTGSLALGGALGAIAIMLKKELLLVIVGGVFVVEVLSVIIQVLSYRYRGGKRVFKMAPIHHHFELLGWPEEKVVVRFWIIGALCTLATLATLKVR
ncbi:MAG TPA: phospho-N-acetylmuramoyl-pentapeptide-transferase [candidate division Zixibacteria bacterium]|nr:phospho-N-acetylmuramoyl-pentapeptide-transferase [candidate division Zixibacteria bacterium]MDD4917969.1 phospho-N-acetylmuramoyl-pentapeptide-transferase [candidate division Zixibacteria bacterium]MDM7972479.1 phospho-N-acetylmuramoyl-pentapeptide-transferase [candidate division Zixibacteria bacterium]HOD65266.1 phospho-N-acetylmuramoyl-pentapeptide-transferase [candidate division Zixibacteria bacterium]HPC10953.1 phospho-N-acetylmuramoyl-pentapeptide-transferase [candidate division Zixiba